MDNSLMSASTAIDPKDLPAGFTLQDPHSNNNSNNGTTNSSSSSSSSSSNANANTAASMQQQQQQKQSILEQVMEPDALARLRRIQLVKPQKATMLENAIIQMATNNQLTEPISDGKFIEMLERQLAQQEYRNSSKNNNNSNASDHDIPSTSSDRQSNSTSSSGISIRRKKYAMDSDDDDDNDDDLL